MIFYTYGQALDWMIAHPGEELWASGLGYFRFLNQRIENKLYPLDNYTELKFPFSSAYVGANFVAVAASDDKEEWYKQALNTILDRIIDRSRTIIGDQKTRDAFISEIIKFRYPESK